MDSFNVFLSFCHHDKDVTLFFMQVLIFLREPGEPVNAKNIDKMIQCTLLKGCPSDSMLRVLQVS